jgi:hypothetical protein
LYGCVLSKGNFSIMFIFCHLLDMIQIYVHFLIPAHIMFNLQKKLNMMSNQHCETLQLIIKSPLQNTLGILSFK